MILSVDALSVTGPVRGKNEDMLSLAGRMLRDSSLQVIDEESGDYWYAFVADGIGGHEGGAEASSMLLEHIRDCFTMGDFSEEDFEGDFILSVEYVSAKLNARSAYLGMDRPMGTTLCGVVWYYDKVYMVNAGDSRMYRWRDGLLRQLSEDQKDSSGLLTNCVGGGMKGTPVVKDITGEVREDDILIICSDGISGYVPDDEIDYYLTSSAFPAEDLCDRASVNGGGDNASVALIKVGGGEFGDVEDIDDDGRFDAWA